MNLGFNTNVRLGGTLCHIQTEDRGADHPFIDTTVYTQGRVLHRRSSSYRDLLGSHAASDAALRQRIEQQHRSVIEELRSGALKLDPPVPAKPAAASVPTGLQVQLLNPASWLTADTAKLQIEVRARSSRQAAAGVYVEVAVEGARGPARFAAHTNTQGFAELSFPLPRLGPSGAALVIRATGPSGEDEIRYQLRPKSNVSAPRAPVR